ncbi:hypothetical protein ES703_69939 [subsurface metagenome]|jgi:hypothetical protein
MVKFKNLAGLDFYVKDIPAHTAGVWEENEIELPSDVDLEDEAMIIYGMETIIQDASVILADGVGFVAPFNFHLLQPSDENDLDTCFMSKLVTYLNDAAAMLYGDEGHVTPFVPIIVLTSFFESADLVTTSLGSNDLAFRIWYDDVPLSQSKMAQLVNILRGEQI